jgi:hypothetical protein
MGKGLIRNRRQSPPRCCHEDSLPIDSHHDWKSPCECPGTIERDGLLYCEFHDPLRAKPQLAKIKGGA